MINKLAAVAVILSALGATVWFTQKPSTPPASTKRGAPLLKSLDTEVLSQIQLKQADESLILEKRPSGTWVLAELDYPASASKIQEFLLKFLETRISDQVTQNPKQHERFEVVSGTQIHLKTQKDQSMLSLILGKERQGGGQYLRYHEQPEVYLVGDPITVDFKTDSWIDTSLLSFDKKLVQRLVIKPHDQAPFVIERPDGDRDDWGSPQLTATEQIKASAVKELIEALRKLEFAKLESANIDDSVTGRTQLTTLEIELFDGRDVSLTLGQDASSDGSHHYLSASMELRSSVSDAKLKAESNDFNRLAEGRLYGLTSWNGKKLLKTRQDLVEAKIEAPVSSPDMPAHSPISP